MPAECLLVLAPLLLSLGSKTFFLLYELFTGTLDVVLLPNYTANHAGSLLGRDGAGGSSGGGGGGGAAYTPRAHETASMLLRMLPPSEACQKGLMISILRALAANPAVCGAMPKHEPAQGASGLMSKESPAARLLRAAHEYLRQHAKVLLWASGARMSSAAAPPAPLYAPPRAYPLAARHEYRLLVVPRSADSQCEERTLHTVDDAALSIEVSARDIACFAGAPLTPLPLGDFVDEGQVSRHQVPAECLPITPE